MRTWLITLVFMAVAACGDDDVSDASTDAANEDVLVVHDAGLDGGSDAGADAAMDAGGMDSSVLTDGGPDAMADVAPDAPGDAGPDAIDAGHAGPECGFIGTRSEGWYEPDGTRICWTRCDGARAICRFGGTRSEGWYAEPTSAGCEPEDRGRIAYDQECDSAP